MMWLGPFLKFGNQSTLFVDLYLSTIHLACWTTHIFEIFINFF